jgi:RpiR family carbohydrate utilization transcriptional regulator
MRIADVAAESGVSEPTVIRFCKAIGFDGYQSFKLQLAQNLGTPTPHPPFALHDSDSTEILRNKVFDTTVGALISVREELDPAALEAAINKIVSAARVEFYGFGASGSVAADAQHKFFRLQLSTAAYTDPHIQHMSAVSLGPRDVVVAISQSGQTKALLQSVRLAKEAGANIIGVAPKNTALSELCNISIEVNQEETNIAHTPVSSRIAHLVVIDVIATGVALHRTPLLKNHLKRLNTSQRALRVPTSET